MITQARLKALFEYNQETGVFINRTDRHYKTPAGSIAGTFSGHGYCYICIDGKKRLAHRLVWLYMTGTWPEFEIDHKDGDIYNNAWDNLREATHFDNMSNRAQVLGTSGFRGVSYDKRRELYSANIQSYNVTRFLGYYKTAEEASCIYEEAAKAVHGEFAFHTRTNQ